MRSSAFYPLQNPFNDGYCDVGQGHRLWYAQYGNPDGIPLLWLHGGPGSGSSPRHQIFADPSLYRLVLCDQRGCGRSTPGGAIADNDTARLVQDIEDLRLHLGLGKVLLGGGSWGAGLALAYAQPWRSSLLGLILRAPFLAGKNDIQRFFQPAADVAGDAWKAFAHHAPATERAHLLGYIAAQLSVDSPGAAIWAQAWRDYERQLAQPDASDVTSTPAPAELQRLLSRYRVQSHYLINHCFLDEADLLRASADLTGLPVVILQGQSDQVCDPDNALRLHAHIPGSRLKIVVGGHDPFQPEMAMALLDALNCFARHTRFD
ncbi:alpha/beta fold hydrolase [Glaciimonas immobilis]|uniref:Proline iminopeptidase n=1 Tax=Glaciimonas immobilis TaxID=728004 RepID=A0A840RSM5_9BURK|nr:alpha/beta fold hydrolase [Glaciimonas immobilis]KAF3999712.1 alpha/beta fold hydrolase [Glaciimonas immobilis]MBB5200162.1 proline iminopeptidase [Glaciimonas immobilis]